MSAPRSSVCVSCSTGIRAPGALLFQKTYPNENVTTFYSQVSVFLEVSVIKEIPFNSGTADCCVTAVLVSSCSSTAVVYCYCCATCMHAHSRSTKTVWSRLAKLVRFARVIVSHHFQEQRVVAWSVVLNLPCRTWGSLHPADGMWTAVGYRLNSVGIFVLPAVYSTDCCCVGSCARVCSRWWHAYAKQTITF